MIAIVVDTKFARRQVTFGITKINPATKVIRSVLALNGSPSAKPNMLAQGAANKLVQKLTTKAPMSSRDSRLNSGSGSAARSFATSMPHDTPRPLRAMHNAAPKANKQPQKRLGSGPTFSPSPVTPWLRITKATPINPTDSSNTSGGVGFRGCRQNCDRVANCWKQGECGRWGYDGSAPAPRYDRCRLGSG